MSQGAQITNYNSLIKGKQYYVKLAWTPSSQLFMFNGKIGVNYKFDGISFRPDSIDKVYEYKKSVSEDPENSNNNNENPKPPMYGGRKRRSKSRKQRKQRRRKTQRR